MRVVANGVRGHAYGGACDGRCVERVPVVVVRVSSVGVATMRGVRGGSIGALEAFGAGCGRVERERHRQTEVGCDV